MNARSTQSDAVQDADEDRKGGVQSGTSTANRRQQRSNVPENNTRVGGFADEQGVVMRDSVNLYEIAVLYHPDLEIDLGKASAKVEKIITADGGKITKTDNWGKRKLTYPIKKQEFAVYVIYSTELPAETVNKIEKTLNITDEVIRFLITRPDLKAIAKAEALKAEKAKKAAERGGDEDNKNNETEEEE